MSKPGPPNEVSRYHRQTLLPQIGEAGQERLSLAHAVVVGVGALGCASADFLARAGVGTITLIDRDFVELTNLQRQTLFSEADIGMPKAEAARKRLAGVNSKIQIHAAIADLTGANAERLIRRDDEPVLIDGTDNFETRYLLNDLAVSRGLAYFYAGVIGMTGMAIAIVPGATPCLRCVFPDPPPVGSTPTCDTAGVLGPAVAIAASRQAADAIRFLVDPVAARALPARLHSFDAWTGETRMLDVSGSGPSADCPCCGQRQFDFLDDRKSADAVSLCGQNAVQISPPAGGEALDLSTFAERLRAVGPVELTPFLLRVTLPSEGKVVGATEREALELSLFHDGRAIIKGTTRPEVARALYARFVGH